MSTSLAGTCAAASSRRSSTASAPMHVPALAVALALAEEDDVISAHSTATIATRSGTRDTVMPRTITRSAQAAVAACRRAGPDTNPIRSAHPSSTASALGNAASAPLHHIASALGSAASAPQM